MNVIFSHDVDHITVFEHGLDLIIPKHVMRNCIEFGLGYISGEEIVKRFKDLLANKWNNLESLMRFDREHDIPSTFFFGVQNGLGLSYKLQDAKFWLNKAAHEGFSIGIHGIAFESLVDIRKEFSLFSSVTGLSNFGIRMHYLRRNAETLHHLASAGYVFDSSTPGLISPYKVHGLWEFPLHIMDGNVLCKKARWQNQTFEQARDATKALLEAAAKLEIEYFTVLLHDRYFSDSFDTWKRWYIWLTEYLKDNKCTFMSYSEAVKKLADAKNDHQ